MVGPEYPLGTEKGSEMNKAVILTGIRYLSIGEADEVPLGHELYLIRPSESLIPDEDRPMFNQLQFTDARNVSRYLLRRYDLPVVFADRDAAIDDAEKVFQSGIAAFQIIKPVETLGIVLRGYEYSSGFHIESVEYRHPMDAGEWARQKAFDLSILPDVIAMIPRVYAVLGGTNAEHKNAVTLLQLGMESYHPLISGMLWVMGMEAIFDSANRTDFYDKICNLLGPDTLVFPDWNPHIGPLSWKVRDIAMDLYMLRNKLAHGVDLRKAATDRSNPVDLLRTVTLHPQSSEVPYSFLLSQAACFLLCQVIQRSI
jgi:hypothetical protein